MRRVIIESPYAGDTALNMRYLRACIRDCLNKGEAPFASHGLYTSALDDNVPEERRLGIDAGREWNRVCHRVVVYRDLGISPGMVEGVKWAYDQGIPVEYRNVEGWVK